MTELTKDADKVLCLLYKRYLENRKDSMSKGMAKLFGGSEAIREALNLTMALDDLDDTLRELGRADYLNNLYADDTVVEVEMTDKAIIMMENRFKNGLREVLEFLSKFIP